MTCRSQREKEVGRAKAVPVLLYHHVNPHRGDLVTLTPNEFEAQLRYLQKRRFRTLFLDELVPFLKGEAILPDRTVALTFDDGYLDNWVYAFPLLVRYEIKATLFAVTSWVEEGAARPLAGAMGNQALPEIPTHREAKARFGQRGRGGDSVNWSELKEMVKSGFVDVQSHTHTHRPISPEGLSIPEIELELRQSRDLIRERLEVDCRFLSWPWGEFTAEAVVAAKAVGFQALLTTRRGSSRPGTDLYGIPRIPVKRSDVGWLGSRISIYSHPLVGDFYDLLRGKQ